MIGYSSASVTKQEMNVFFNMMRYLLVISIKKFLLNKIKRRVKFNQKLHINFKYGRASHYKCNAQVRKLI